MASLNQLLDAQKRFQEQLMKKSGVVGVAVGYRSYKGEMTNQLALVALVERKQPIENIPREDLVPRDLEGAATDVYEVGRIEALNTSPRDRFRPQIPGGVSIGHYKITAGTLGVMVKDRTTGERLILSNNHVLANSNEAMIGDPILQPAPIDHGTNSGDIVAHLERYVKLQFIGDPPPPGTNPDPKPDPEPEPTPDPEPEPTPDPKPDPQPPVTGNPPPSSSCDVVSVIVALGNALARLNGSDQRLTASSAGTMGATAAAQSNYVPDNRVDCAVGRPVNPDMFRDEIRDIGIIDSTRLPALGMSVRKSGRTTGYTEGMVTLLNATVNVSYNTSAGTRSARFVGQAIATGMSQGGDSGSLVVDKGSNAAVGLLFAGSSVATIFTPIGIVLDTLNIDLGG